MKRNRKYVPLIDQLESRAYLSAAFGNPTFYGGMDNVAGIAVGGLSGSGKQDIVVTGDRPGTTQAALGVYLSKGSGTYPTAPTLLNNPGTPGPVTMGDFLGNGKLDVATVDPSSGLVNVFLNDGTGSFSPGVGGGTGLTSADSIAAGDFNHDGKTDLAVADSTGNQVLVLISAGRQFGSFVGGNTIPVPSPTKVIATDVSGDGIADLVIASADGMIYVAINDGNANFATPVTYSIGSSIQSVTDVATADFNADNHPDLVGVGVQSGTGAGVVGVLLNQGNGTFAAPGSYITSNGATLVGTGNFTNTGGIDLADITSTGGLDVLAHGGAVGTFQTSQPFFTNQLGTPGSDAVFADLDGDGKTDLAYLSPSNSGFGVVLNTPGGSVVPPPGGNTSTLVPTLSGVLPPQVVSGTKLKPIHDKVTINNNAASAVIGTAKIEIVLSTAATPGVNDPTIATITRKVHFNAHQSKSFLLNVTSLPATPAGSYYFDVRVTDPTLKTNTAPSSAAVSVVPPTIDLSGTFLSVPATARIGHHVSAGITITNSGTVATNKRLEIKLYASTSGTIDGNALLIADVLRPAPIRPGQTVKVRISKTISKTAASASYYLIAQLDPANVFSDVNLANNTFVSSSTVALS